MKKLMSLVLGTVVGAGMTLASMPAEASCVQFIYAEEAFTFNSSATIRGRTTSSSTIFWQGSTTDPEMMNAIAAAVAQRNRVEIIGNATSCATTGTFRSVGTLTEMIISP